MRVILNGKAAGDERVRAAVHSLRKEGARVETRVTWEAGDAVRLTKEAIAELQGSEACVVAGGGDGTVNEVFGAAFAAGLPPSCSLGILPLGTANDFARSAGLPVDDLTAALRIAATAPPRWMDLGLVDGRPFVNLVTGGFGSRVTVETDPELKKRLGRFAYAITGLKRFPELAATRGAFEAEGFHWEGLFGAVGVGNGRQAGGGVPMCPDAFIDDGLLDLTILPDLSQFSGREIVSAVLREGPAAIRSGLVTARAAAIEVTAEEDLNINLDGEPTIARRFSIECRPRAVKVRLGDSPLFSKSA